MVSAPAYDWFLKEWLASLNIKQVRLSELAEWDKRKTSYLVNGRQPFNRDTLNEAAHALNLRPWELLMHPKDAMEIRQLRKSVELAAERRMQYIPQDETNRFTGTDN